MLAIRMQRTGRKGHAQFRLIVQESRRTPSSGNVIAALGSYDPHTKAVILDKEQAAKYLNNGAQPSPRMAMILQKEGIKLPSWVKVDDKRTKSIKNTEKLRRNQTPAPVEAESSTSSEADSAAEAAPEEVVAEAPTEVAEEAPAVEETVAVAEETTEAVEEAEAPAEETKAEETAEATEEETEKTA